MTSEATPSDPLDTLLKGIRACRICRDAPLGAPLAHEPRPVVRVSSTARLLVAGQAPGARVHKSGLPFTDPSGDRLRDWMGVDATTFYDESKIAIVPMGFCFPGYDDRKSDLPPRPECRARWHGPLLDLLPGLQTILVVGAYAREFYFGRLGLDGGRQSLTETVRRWRDFENTRPRVLPLPHPSWRNSGWLKANPWFAEELLPVLRREVKRAVESNWALTERGKLKVKQT